MGQLKECATRFFKEDIFVRIQDDISSNECKKYVFFFNGREFCLFQDTHIVFRVDFNNFMARSIERRLMQGPKLPDVTSSTFFKVIERKSSRWEIVLAKKESSRYFHLLFYLIHKCEFFIWVIQSKMFSLLILF